MFQTDEGLLSRWNIRHTPDPDFERLRKVLLRQGIPDRVPLFEVNIDDEVLAAILGEPVRKPDYMNEEESQRYVQQVTRAYYHLGYDYIMLPVYLPMESFLNVAADTAALAKEKGRAWVDETRGPVTNWEEFERFNWCEVEDADCLVVEYTAQVLPEEMGLLVRTRGMMEWLMRLMGFETLCYALADDPGLVEAISDRMSELIVGLVRRLAQMDGISAILYYDDMGFKTGTFLSPRHLK